MQYKTSFFLTAVGQLLTSFSAFLGIYFLFARFNTVEGFDYTEVMLCFATVLMAYSLAECLGRGFDTFTSTISNGEFDRYMVRPRGLILQVLGSKIDYTRVGRLLQAVIIFAYAIPASGVIWTWDKIITLILMIVSGFFVFMGLFILYAALCFFTIEGLEFMNIFTYGSSQFGSYPFSVYGKSILKFFTYVIPIALFQYYPFLYLIGRSSDKLYMFLPLLSMLILIPCYGLWRLGIRHYKSTGS